MDILKSALAKFLSGCVLLFLTAIIVLAVAYFLNFDICTIVVSLQPSVEFCRPTTNVNSADVNATAIANAIQQTSVALQQAQPIVAVATVPAMVVTPRTQPTAQVVPPQETLGDNLVVDGNFENGLGGWTYADRHKAGLIYPVAGYSGNGVCSRQNLTENDAMGWVGIGRDVLVQAGKAYKYSAWVKWENATEFNAHLEWRIPTQYLPAFQVVNGTNNNWQLWEAGFTVPNDVNQLRLAFWHGVKNNNTNVPSGIICVDEVSLRQIK